MHHFRLECRGGGVGTAEAARCGNGGKGTGGLCQWFQWGAADDKVGKTMRC